MLDKHGFKQIQAREKLPRSLGWSRGDPTSPGLPLFCDLSARSKVPFGTETMSERYGWKMCSGALKGLMFCINLSNNSIIILSTAHNHHGSPLSAPHLKCRVRAPTLEVSTHLVCSLTPKVEIMLKRQGRIVFTITVCNIKIKHWSPSSGHGINLWFK